MATTLRELPPGSAQPVFLELCGQEVDRWETEGALVVGEPSAKPVAFLGVHAPPALASGHALGSRQYITASAFCCLCYISSVQIEMQPLWDRRLPHTPFLSRRHTSHGGGPCWTCA